MSISDKAIKASAEDTSFVYDKSNPNRLKSGETHAKYVRACEIASVVPPNYTAVIVIDYMSWNEKWDHNLVNFYYEFPEDPRTRIISFRVGNSMEVTNT